jgi:hypothetical protein
MPSRKVGIVMIGVKNGRLTVIAAAGVVDWDADHRESLWKCSCECGKEVVIPRSKIKRNISCGCSRKGNKWASKWDIGKNSRTLEYNSWKSMKGRCYNQNDPAYGKYGGRGILVCDEWNASFGAFREYMGPKPGLDYSIDRIDNDGHYEPGNVRWASPKEQARNRRRQLKMVVDGETKMLAELAEKSGVPYQTALWRFKQGWSTERILTPAVTP